MSVALNANYQAELNKAQNTPVTIIEIEFDSGTLKYGTHDVFSDVLVCLSSPTSSQNKLDTEKGYSTRGNISFSIIGRDNFKPLVQNEYPKNRRVNRYDGFVGLAFSDYVKTFTGTIQGWTRKGDQLNFTVEDDVQKVTLKIPEANEAGTQSINYMNTNPVDIMLDILKTQLAIDASVVDTTQFEFERDLWRNAWVFHRVLREPIQANKLLNELQEQTFSYIFHDGQKVNYKADEPPTPNSVVLSFSDDDNLLENSINATSGYKSDFFNRIEVLYDYDESDDNETSNYETREIVIDIDSQSAGEWDETKTKTIKSQWLRTFQWNQPVNITGIVQLYHASKDNGLSAGATGSSIAYTQSTNSITWTAPDGTTGTPVVLESDGDYQVFDTNLNKSIRIRVDVSALPVGDQSDTISITAGSGDIFASTLANKILSKYRDPVTSVSFNVSLNDINNGGALLQTTDTIKLTTDEAFDFGRDSWTDEQMLITSVRPDFKKGMVSISASQKRAGNQAGLRKAFIAGGNEITLTGVSGVFVVGETITGSTSLATAVITRISGSVLSIIGIVGAFQLSETITGGTSLATGTSSILNIPPDYPTATDAQRQYAFIGDASNLVNAGTEDGYYII